MRAGIVIAALLVITVLATATAAYAEVPDWVRIVAGLWSEGHIDDDTYLSTIT